MKNIKQAIKTQFGKNAEKYVSSDVHARGDSLRVIVDLVQPQYDWTTLDVATGGGHNALAFSTRSGIVISGDMTNGMVKAARKNSLEKTQNILMFIQFDAEQLPFSNQMFDCVTSRIAPHHFPNVRTFISEAARTLKPGGTLAIADNVSSEDDRDAKYFNAFEKLRDPSHHWAYSALDWSRMIEVAGLVVENIEHIKKDLYFQDWLERTNCSPLTALRLEALMCRAPTSVANLFDPRVVGGRLVFSIEEAVIVARKPKS